MDRSPATLASRFHGLTLVPHDSSAVYHERGGDKGRELYEAGAMSFPGRDETPC